MTAQISPNRMEVSDRFPMLGFAVRTSQPDVEAEVVIATDIGLFSAQNRPMRNAANFYTSREHGTLRVPRGDGVFVVPPEVLARFIGNEKLYFGLATGSGGAGGLQVDALPREGSPYVSLRGFTGRTLRRGFGALRPTAPKLDWAGDQPRPGSEPAPAASAPAPAAASPAEPVPYDDGFGPMPEIPARESAYRAPRQPVVPAGQGDVALSLGTGTTAQAALAWIRRKIEQGVSAAGSEVEPPSMLYLGAASGTFRTAWQAGLGITGLINPFNAFLAAIPTLARETGVTLSIGPALDTPLFGAGIGVVFAPDGQVALFGQGEISLDFDGLSEFVRSLKLALAARMKLGYNRGGLAAFADISTVAGIIVGEEIVGGAEIWLDSRGSGIGGAVSIGVGFALQLAEEESAKGAIVRPVMPGDARARATRIGGEFAPQIHRALDSGLEEAALQRLLDTLDPPTTATPLSAMAALPEAVRPAQKLPAGALSGGGANAAEIVQAGVAVVGLVEKWGEGDISYQVDKFEGWHRPQQAEGQPLRTVDRASAVVEWDDGGFLDAIGLKLRIAWDHDGWSVGNVLITPFGFNDAVGDALFVRAEIVKTGQPFNGITTPFTRSGAGGAPASPADYAGNPGAMLEIIVTYRRGRMVRNDVTEGRRILLLPTGQYVEMVMALD